MDNPNSCTAIRVFFLSPIIIHVIKRQIVRVKYDTSVRRQVLPVQTPEQAQARANSSMEVVKLLKGEQLEVLEVDEEKKEIKAIYPIDPERVIIIASEAVEFFNEAVGLWQSFKALLKSVVVWFRGLGGLFKKKEGKE